MSRARPAEASSCVALVSAVFLLSGCNPTGDTDTADSVATEDFKNFDQQVRAYYEKQAACLTEAGFPTTVNADGSITISGIDFERDAQVVRRCDDVSGEHPELPTPSEEGLSEFYARLLDVHECLEANGLSSVQPPSEQVFIESYLASLQGGSSDAPWHPYAEFSSEVEKKCPAPLLEDVYLE